MVTQLNNSPSFHAKGLTLVELMMTLAITSFIMSVAIPSFTSMIRNNQRTVLVNELVSVFFYAKTEAIKRHRQVIICGSDDGIRCHYEDNWASGWLVFVNADKNHPPSFGLHDTILTYRQMNMPHYVKSNRAYYRFTPTSKRVTNGTLTICDERGEYEARAVIISATGRPRTAKTLADGSPIPCEQP